MDNNQQQPEISPEEQDRRWRLYMECDGQGAPHPNTYPDHPSQLPVVSSDKLTSLGNLHVSVAEIGAYPNQPKSQASGQSRINPYTESTIKLTSHGERRARDRSLRGVDELLEEQRRKLVPNPAYDNLRRQPIRTMGEVEVRPQITEAMIMKAMDHEPVKPLTRWARIKVAVAAAFRKVFGN